MKDDAVIKDNEAVYLLNEQTYLHLRENLAGVGYEVFDKNSPLPVEEGQIPREALGNTQRRIETARAYYLAEHQDEPVGRIQNVAVTTLEKFRSGVRKRRNLAPRSLPDNDVRFIDPQYNELFRVPDGGVVQITYPDGHQRSASGVAGATVPEIQLRPSDGLPWAQPVGQRCDHAESGWENLGALCGQHRLQGTAGVSG